MEKQKRNLISKTGRYLTTGLILITALGAAGFRQITQNTGENIMLINDLLQPFKLPQEYLITYEIESQNGKLIRITRGKDAEGRIYFNSLTEEVLFIPSGRGYQMYYADIDGTFVNLDQTRYTAKFVEETTQDFLHYAQKSAIRHSATAKHIGETQVAERSGKVYEINIKLSIFSQRYTFVIDDETGICLEWKSATNISDHDLTPGGNFTCIEFQTEDIRLPISEIKIL